MTHNIFKQNTHIRMLMVVLLLYLETGQVWAQKVTSDTQTDYCWINMLVGILSALGIGALLAINITKKYHIKGKQNTVIDDKDNTNQSQDGCENTQTGPITVGNESTANVTISKDSHNTTTVNNYYGGEHTRVVVPLASHKGETDFDRDTQTLNELFSYFSTNLMDDFLRNDPTYIDSRIVLSSDCWYYITSASSFAIYDTELKQLLLNFNNAFRNIVERGGQYYENCEDPTKYKFFGLKHDMFDNQELEQVFNQFVKDKQTLYGLYSNMMEYIKTNFRIDLQELSQTFEVNNSYNN